MPDNSIHSIVTSPPYWNLRDYGHPEQIGLEDTPEAFVEALASVFDEAYRVLKPWGTLWLNLGDTYAGACGAQRTQNLDKYGEKIGTGGGKKYSRNQTTPPNPKRFKVSKSKRIKKGPGNRWGGGNASVNDLPAKSLLGMPWRVAFALQSRGWILRQDIIWHKPNPMPESVRDRCTKAHEYIFLFSKGPRYYFHQDAIRTPLSDSYLNKSPNGFAKEREWFHNNQTRLDPRKLKYNGQAQKDYESNGVQNPSEVKRRILKTLGEKGGANRKSVWSIAAGSFKEAHFATFPESLAKLCIMAGCPPGGVVYDPFMGAGTVAVVAYETGRKYLGSEISAEYVEIIANRLRKAEKQRNIFEFTEEPDPALFEQLGIPYEA